MSKVDLNELEKAIYRAYDLDFKDMNAIISNLKKLDNLDVDTESSEESPYYPYQYNTVSVIYNDDVILEFTETDEGEVSMSEISVWLLE